MQTFLPYQDFTLSAQVLDRQRLGKQRVETLQLLKALSGETKGWVNHPAAKMWRGYENSLVAYGVAICDEWIRRGYKDTCKGKILSYRKSDATDTPRWLGNDSIHASHRSNLLRKDANFYGQYGWTEPDDLPYDWAD
jgi:hypothetical protein